MDNNNFDYQVAYNPNNKKNPISYFKFILILSIVLVIAIIVVFGKQIFFPDKHEVRDNDNNDGMTLVVSDNVYDKVSINSRDDAVELITIDSDTEKEKCDNEEIKKIERRLEVKHDIIAVNLCELDLEYAKELEKTVDKVFVSFPTVKGYLTNITLTNPKDGANYIAAFTATQLFATSNSVDTYPHVYKMVMNLNASYFLDLDYLKDSVISAENNGYFPKGASITSVVAHEFGHYISFVALLRSTFLNDTLLLSKDNYSRYKKLVDSWNAGDFSKKLIDEAYNNYKKKYKNSVTEHEFKSSISEYAVSTDNNGDYIYDETVAEAFHDYYLNGSKAKKASLEIIKVLKKYMNGYKED